VLEAGELSEQNEMLRLMESIFKAARNLEDQLKSTGFIHPGSPADDDTS